MAKVAVLGEFRCNCCCDNRRVEHTDEDVEAGYMRCTGCNCSRVRMGSASTITLRVQVVGSPTVGTITKAAELAAVLGAPDDIALKRENDALYYFEVDALAALNRLEIQKLRTNQRGSN